MSVIDQRSGAARLLARALVIAGTVAGVSGAWLVANAEAESTDPAAERSVVDAGTELVSDVLAPAAPLVQRETPLTPVVDSLTGTLRETGSTLEPVGDSIPIDEEPPPEEPVGEPQQDGPLGTVTEHEAVPPPAVPEPRPEPSDGTTRMTAPHVPTADSTIEPSSAPEPTNDDQDGPTKPAHRHHGGAQPASPAPTTGGADNGHGSHSGFGFYWHDGPRSPGIAPVGAPRYSGPSRLIGVAGPQPGTTPD